MISKKQLMDKIEALYTSYEHINNFDELYKKIMSSYQDSKMLINEQILQYDKKIIQNNTIVDTRLNEFRSKIDNSISLNNEHFDTLINDWRNKISESFVEHNTDLDNRANTLTSKINDLISESYDHNREIINTQKSSFDKICSEIKDKINELTQSNTESINAQLTEQEKEYLIRINEEILKQSSIWNDKITSITGEVKNVLEKYEIDVYEMINSIAFNKINSVLIEDISAKATENILNAFNKVLVNLKQPEADSIIDAIKGLLNSKISGLVKKEEIREPLKPITDTELFHKNHDKLKTCIDANTKESPIIPMIVGPAGTGKSTAVEQISREMGLHFYMANRIQNTFELVGFVDAAGNYVTTQFYEAFTKGGLFLFDEVDASSPEALVTINAAIAQGYMAFPGNPRPIEMHSDFKVVCAGNTFGTGSTLQYTGRNKLDAATLDRFMIIEWDYDTELESKLIKDDNLLNFCWILRSESAKVDPSVIISTRGIITLERVFNQNAISKAFSNEEILKQKFFETTKKESLLKIKEAVSQTMNSNPYFKYLELLTKK
ncbi:MAG: AAA family ATPase [Acholeplasmatales bacterium]|jgi:FtsZ-binding cell division protein ZapB|nr:AAA family ATPase [Acholeplasmatales bacterium]